MTDRLAETVNPLVDLVAPIFRREVEKDVAELGDLASATVDEAQPTFRVMGVGWAPVPGAAGFECAEPRMWPLYRCSVTRDLSLDDEAILSHDSLARGMAVEASFAFSKGVRDVLWEGAQAEHGFPVSASKLREYVASLGGRAVLVVAKGTEVSAELTAVVDDVKKVPARLMAGAGYLRASVSGPSIELTEAAWQVGWDRIGDKAARLVAVRTARLPHLAQAIRLLDKS